MAKAADVKAMKPLSESFDADDEGWLDKIIADEDEPDRNTLWRLGSWAIAAVVALTLGLMSGQLPDRARRSDVAQAELTSQAARIEDLARETKQETRRIAAAVDTLNSDRDRLFDRLTAVEQNLDSVTGSIARQAAPPTQSEAAPDKPVERAIAPAPVAADTAPAPQPAPAPTAAAEPPKDAPAKDATLKEHPKDAPKPASAQGATAQSAAAADSTAKKTDRSESQRTAAPTSAATNSDANASSSAPAQQSPVAQDFDPAATTTVPKAVPGQQVAATPPAVVTAAPLTPLPDNEVAAAAAPEIPVERTQFGLDIGGASSMVGLRALWSGVRKSHPSQFAALRPVLAIRQNKNGLGLQVHVVAGPIPDAAAAAKLCAALAADNRQCETAIFDGQRLLPDTDEVKKPAATPKPARRKQAQREPQPPAPAPQPAGGKSSVLSFIEGH
jgi:uncharacterized membrane-anchored protein YhcB (DUF1043 family)